MARTSPQRLQGSSIWNRAFCDFLSERSEGGRCSCGLATRTFCRSRLCRHLKGRERARVPSFGECTLSRRSHARRRAANAPFSRILQFDRLRFLESIAKSDLAYPRPLVPPFRWSAFHCHYLFPTCKAEIFLLSNPRSLSRIIQSTFSSHDDRISLSSSSHV